jgi:hypothetical protein
LIDCSTTRTSCRSPARATALRTSGEPAKHRGGQPPQRLHATRRGGI